LLLNLTRKTSIDIQQVRPYQHCCTHTEVKQQGNMINLLKNALNDVYYILPSANWSTCRYKTWL